MALWLQQSGEPELRPDEPPVHRWLCAGLAVLVALCFFWVVSAFNVSAHHGVDQNGYLVGGKQLAHEFQPVLQYRNQAGEIDPYGFVGRMWIGADIGTDAERYYPKYPSGLPLLVAACFWVGGDSLGPILTYWINPICMSLGVLATFFVVRLFVGSTLGLIAQALIASCPVTLALATNPNSHASTLACATWGMFFLLTFSRTPSFWRAVCAGLLIGYAATIRYTEGLLILPMFVVLLLSGQWKRPRWYAQAGAMGLAWLLPVGMLVLLNLYWFGALTGYDPTNESTGFAWEYFIDNWKSMLTQINGVGLVFFFPIAIAGMIGLFAWHWRVALVLSSWIVPSVLLYTAYYWAPDNFGVGYMRFFLPVLPPLAIAACAVLAHLLSLSTRPEGGAPSPRWYWPVAGGVLAALAVLVNLDAGLHNLEVDQLRRIELKERADQIVEALPTDREAVIFSRDRNLLHHLQFICDADLYELRQFDRWQIRRMGEVDPDDPQGLQPQRQMQIYGLLSELNQGDLDKLIRGIADEAFEQGGEVFVVDRLRRNRNREIQPVAAKRTFPREEFDAVVVQNWGRGVPGRFSDDDFRGRRIPRARKSPPRPSPPLRMERVVRKPATDEADGQTASR